MAGFGDQPIQARGVLTVKEMRVFPRGIISPMALPDTFV